MKRRIQGWLEQFRGDLKESADPALLGGLRIFGLLYGRIDRSLPIDEALKKAWSRRLPANVGWQHAFGGVAYFLFMMLVVSGVLLTFYYRPSVEDAYPSIQFIVTEAPFGWLIRDMHVWSANLIVLALLAHMIRVLFAGAYKPPRETSWFVGVALLLVVFAFGITGYLLPWDQWAYWATSGFMSSIEGLPLIGGPLALFLRGDRIVSSATLSRFFALHVVVLPWLAFGLISLHFVIVRSHGVAGSEGLSPDEGMPFYPNHLVRILVVSVFLIAIVGSLAALFPRPVGDPATAFYPPDEMVSTWIPVDVTRAIVEYLGSFGLILAVLLAMVVVFLPFFDRNPETELRKRPVVAVLGTLLLVGFLLAWAVGHSITDPVHATGAYQEAIDGRASPPIPASGLEAAEEPGTDPVEVGP